MGWCRRSHRVGVDDGLGKGLTVPLAAASRRQHCACLGGGAAVLALAIDLVMPLTANRNQAQP